MGVKYYKCACCGRIDGDCGGHFWCVHCEEFICEYCPWHSAYYPPPDEGSKVCETCYQDDVTDRQRVKMLQYVLDHVLHRSEEDLREEMRKYGRLKPAYYGESDDDEEEEEEDSCAHDPVNLLGNGTQ